MKRKIIVIFLLLLFALSAIACAKEFVPACPFCGNNAVAPTGKTAIQYGKKIYEWSGTCRHVWWSIYATNDDNE